MFFLGNGIDRKSLYIILGILVVISLLNSGTPFLITTILTLPGVLIAISFHEYAHAWTANYFGDYTPKSQGRLTLNPIAHIDPFGLVLLIFAGIGWGKPVEINPNNFTSNKSRSKCEMLVSLAGPMMNFIIAIVSTFIYFAMRNYAPVNQISEILRYIVWYTITINIGLGIFNLIPLPPLDGEKIFRGILPYKAIEWLDRNSNILQIIFMILWITGLLGNIVSPIVDTISKFLFKFVGSIFALF